MTPEQKAEIEAMRAKFTALDIERKAALGRLNAAVVATSPFLPGDVIRSQKGNLAFVKSISAFNGESPRLSCLKMKKDGTPSVMRNHLWESEWKNPTLHHRPDPKEGQ